MTATDLFSAVTLGPHRGTYGPTLPAVRVPIGDVPLAAPLVVRGAFSPEVRGDSISGTRLVCRTPLPGGYAVEFGGCDRPRLSDLTVKLEAEAAGGVRVCNWLDPSNHATNTTATVERVWVESARPLGVRYGVHLDNTAGGVMPNQNGEYHAVRDCVIGGVHTGVAVGSTQAHRCVVRDTVFADCYHGVYARDCGSQLVERCSFANVVRPLTFGDQYGGPAAAKWVNAEGAKQLFRAWLFVGAVSIEDVRCDGMRPFPADAVRTDDDPYDAEYMTAAIMISMGGVCRLRRVMLGCYDPTHPLRMESHRDSADVEDLQIFIKEGCPRPVWLAKYGRPRNWRNNLLVTLMNDGRQVPEPFEYTAV